MVGKGGGLHYGDVKAERGKWVYWRERKTGSVGKTNVRQRGEKSLHVFHGSSV